MRHRLLRQPHGFEGQVAFAEVLPPARPPITKGGNACEGDLRLDATAGVAEDWMYEQIAQRYLLDEDVAAFMSRSNPWAARAIAERLLEAAERGLWSAPEDDTLTDIRERFLALEGELEEAGT